MRRRPLIVVVFLLAGAVVNVAVAWGLQLWGKQYIPDPFPDVPWHSGTLGPSELSSWARASGQEWPERPKYAGVQQFVGGSFILLLAGYGEFDLTGLTDDEFQERRMQQVYYTVFIVKRGWPALTFGMERRSENHYPKLFQWQYNGYPVAGRYIPIRPIWPGFAVNTVFYAALCGLPICGPFTLRRFLRLRRGLCPKCAYPMGDAAVCSECGVELPARARATA